MHLKGVMNELNTQADELSENLVDESSGLKIPNLIVQEPRRGDVCPMCRQGTLDYDGLLNLACSQCGYAIGGCFT